MGDDNPLKILQNDALYSGCPEWTKEEAPVSLPIPREDAAGYTYRHAGALAKQVRDQLDLGDRPGLSLLSVLEEVCGIKVFHLDFQPTGTAASTKSDSFGPAVLLNKKNVRWRRNFDLAHELFHLLTWDVFRALPGDKGGGSSRPGKMEETLANIFASNLLMPMEAIRNAISAKADEDRVACEDVFDIARQFDVSTDALLWRMHNLAMLSGDKDTTCNLIDRTRDLSAVMEDREDSSPAKLPERYRALAIKALRHGLFSTGRFAEYMAISRHEAAKYAQQEVTDGEEIPLAPAGR